MVERMEKHEEWHARYDKPGSGHKVDKSDKFEGETSVVHERRKDKGKSDESRVEAAPLSRKARENLRQEPDDEEKLLARNPESKNTIQRKRAPEYLPQKEQPDSKGKQTRREEKQEIASGMMTTTTTKRKKWRSKKSLQRRMAQKGRRGRVVLQDHRLEVQQRLRPSTPLAPRPIRPGLQKRVAAGERSG